MLKVSRIQMERRMHLLLCFVFWISSLYLVAEDIDFSTRIDNELSEEMIDITDPLVELSLGDSLIASIAKVEEEEPPLPVALLDAMPSSIVAGCVNVISGAFFDSEVDLKVPGPLPLVVQRTYSSQEKKWHFQYMPLLRVFVSQGKSQLIAEYQDDGGSGIRFQGSRHEKNLKLSSSHIRHGLTNCNSEEVSGQTNWKNSTLFFEENEKLYHLLHGSHVERIFSKQEKKPHGGDSKGEFYLVQERHPSKNHLDYVYNKHNALTAVKAFNEKNVWLGELIRKPEGTSWSSSVGEIHYTFKEKKLVAAKPTHGIETHYETPADL